MITELSILIPVFNLDVRPLVKELHAQCRKLPIRYEILLFDDASDEQYRVINREIVNLPHLVYQELPKNIGRAAIRNKLAAAASFAYLLMLDNDCMPSGNDFVATYVKEAAEEVVVVGGVAYQPEVPAQTYCLHWKYGQRAARPLTERQQAPYKNIYLSNALVPKNVFMRFQLCEALKTYGHEDTLFALKLERHTIPLKHIQNPVVHLGLEPTAVFLFKTEQAVDNLVKLYAKGTQLDTLKLVKAYRLLEEKKLRTAFVSAYKLSHKMVEQNLYSSNPNMLLFDLYRLFLFTKKMQRK